MHRLQLPRPHALAALGQQREQLAGIETITQSHGRQSRLHYSLHTTFSLTYNPFLPSLHHPLVLETHATMKVLYIGVSAALTAASDLRMLTIESDHEERARLLCRRTMR
jgi:hypothetical protein